MTYLLVNVLIAPGQQIPESETLPAERLAAADARGARRARHRDRAARRSTFSFVFALLCCLLVWLFVWQTRYGYALRVVGQNEAAAVYGGISPARQIMLAMTISGALAGFVALNIDAWARSTA